MFGKIHYRNSKIKKFFSFVLFLLVFSIAFPQLFSLEQDNNQIPNVRAGKINWLNGWSYRKSHTINYAYGAGSNYQVKIIVYYGDGGGAWTSKQSLPSGRADIPAATFNNLIYILGGYGTSSSNYRGEVYTYNPFTDQWAQKASMHYSRWGGALAVYGGIGYLFGGADGSSNNKVEAYNFATNSWTVRNNLPANLVSSAGGQGAITVGSFIYVFCGSYVYQYNPRDDSYTQKANAPISRRWATYAYASVLGEGRIYVIGGWDGISGTTTNYYYKPATNVWSSAQASVPYQAYGTLRDNPVINGYIYYGFGYYGNPPSNFVSYMYRFDPTSNTWSYALTNATQKRDGVGCAVINSKLYVIGGRNKGSNPYGLTYNEEFDPSKDGWNSVGLHGKCRTDFGDVRFTASNGATLLNYWMEQKSNSKSAAFWIKISNNLNYSPAKIYIYYGNSDKLTVSSGAKTFNLFDDFNRATSTTIGNGWTEDEDSGVGALSIFSNTLQITQYQNYFCHIQKASPSLSTLTLQGKINCGANSGQSWEPAISVYWSPFNYIKIGTDSSQRTFREESDISGIVAARNLGTMIPETWYYFRIRIDSANVYTEYSLNGDIWTTIASISRPPSWSGAPSLIIIGKGYARSFNSLPNADLDNNNAIPGNIGTHYVDDVFVRKYVASEPSHGGWGVEQTR